MLTTYNVLAVEEVALQKLTGGWPNAWLWTGQLHDVFGEDRPPLAERVWDISLSEVLQGTGPLHLRSKRLKQL